MGFFIIPATVILAILLVIFLKKNMKKGIIIVSIILGIIVVAFLLINSWTMKIEVTGCDGLCGNTVYVYPSNIAVISFNMTGFSPIGIPYRNSKTIKLNSSVNQKDILKYLGNKPKDESNKAGTLIPGYYVTIKQFLTTKTVFVGGNEEPIRSLFKSLESIEL